MLPNEVVERRARRALSVVAALLIAAPLRAQRPAVSVLAGGMVVGRSHLGLLRAAVERGRGALSVEGVFDDYTADRGAPARDYYRALGYGVSARGYWRRVRRGPWGEVGLAQTHPMLRVTYPDGSEREARGRVPLLGWGAGWRWRLGRSAVHPELGFRSSVFLREQHLHTDPVAPAPSRDEAISARSWYFGRGRTSSTAYVGLSIAR